MNLNKWKSPETDSIKSLGILGAIVILIIFIASAKLFNGNSLLGFINQGGAVSIDVTLNTIPEAGTVESGVYGTHTAKMYDEMATKDNWLGQATDLMQELDINVLRYPAGGVIKYHHVWTDHMTQTLTAEETSKLVNGNEIRGLGQIRQDRIDEESRGNDGELGEITNPLPKYGNLSYLEGFQDLQPRNFIHDAIDIVNATGAKMLYVINMRYANPAEVAQEVAYLLNNGVDIVGYEFENEVYAKGGFYYQTGKPATVAPLSVTNYLNDADTYRDAILPYDPDAVFAVVASPKQDYEETADGFDADKSFNGYWNIALANQMGAHGYSNYVAHFYHPFFPCATQFASRDIVSVFTCSTEELRNFASVSKPASGSQQTPITPFFDYYYNLFPSGSKLWVTEWNMNMDPTRTAGLLANSILHGAMVTQFENLVNKENATHGNFIKYTNIHTFATDGANALVNKRTVAGKLNTEPLDSGDFVRRTSFFAMKYMNDIFDDGYKPLQASFTSANTDVNNDLQIYAYKKQDGGIALSLTNLSDKTIKIASLTLDGQLVSLDSNGSTQIMHGDENYSSKGATEFSANPGHEVETLETDFNSLNDLYIPSHGFGTVKITPSYEVAGPGPMTPPSPDNNTSYTEQLITYATTPAGTKLQFKLSYPNGAINPLPVVFFLHGGQFGPGGTNAADGYVDQFTGYGYAVAEVTYRPLPEGIFPLQLQDIKGAIRYARAHADELNLDPNKIAVLGSSSGGMIMSLAGTTGNVEYLEGTTGGNTGYSSRPNAVVNLFGSIDPANPFNLSDTVASGYREFNGCAVGVNCSDGQNAVAANYADSTDPSFLTIHGTEDIQIFFVNSVAVDAIYDAAGMNSTLIPAPGVGHDKITILNNYMSTIIDFLDTELYGGQSPIIETPVVVEPDPIPEPILDTTAPSTPTALVASDIGTNSLYLTWSPSTDNVAIASYQVYVDGKANNLSAVNSSVITGLEGGKSYSMTVTSTDTSGNTSSASQALSVQTPGGECGLIGSIIGSCTDTTPPTVSFTTPSYQEIVSPGIYTIKATADDASGIKYVQFFVDGTDLGKDKNAPYESQWNAVSLTPGTYTISATALDARGNESTITIPVQIPVPPDTTPPSISISYPTNNAKLSGTVDNTISASDNVSIAKIVRLVDGNISGEKIVNSSTYTSSWSWDVSAFKSGDHTLVIKAYDDAGNEGSSPTISFTIVGTSTTPVPPPSTPSVSIVTIDSPKTNSTISGTVSITASAPNDGSVVKVEFYRKFNSYKYSGGTPITYKIGTDTTAPYSYDWNTSTFAEGLYTLTAKAYDKDNNVVTSDGVSVKIVK